MSVCVWYVCVCVAVFYSWNSAPRLDCILSKDYFAVVLCLNPQRAAVTQRVLHAWTTATVIIVAT